MATRNELIYFFDTSAFVTLGRTHEQIINIPKQLWERLETMMQQQKLFSHEIVYNEIVSPTSTDFISTWIGPKKKFFLSRSDEQKKIVPDIIRKFPGLIDYKQEREQADPWIIALAIEKSKDQTLFQKNISIVVSQESQKSDTKIPAACLSYSIKHLSLRQFFDEIGLSTIISA